METIKYEYTNNRWANGREHRNLMKPILLDALEELFPNDKWVVHHRDGNKSNNDIFNLEVMKLNEHARNHGRGKHSIERREINSKSHRGNTKSIFPYAVFNKYKNPERKCWISQLTYFGKNKKLGLYEDPLTASIIGSFVRRELDAL